MTRRLLRIFSPFLLLLCSVPLGAQVRLNLYAGPFTFNVSSSGVGALESAVAAGGDALMVNRSGTLTTAYTVRDHLGSTRAVVGRDGTVLECDEYYPFGQRHDLGRNYPVLASSRLKYNGKEQQDIASLSLPYLDYGARLYNPAILRWNAQDPLQEKYYGVSPFTYCADSPVNLYDPDGRDVKVSGEEELDVIRNTLPKEARQYVQISKDGFIDKELLSSYSGASNNFSSLVKLVESERTILFSISDSFQYMGSDGSIGFGQLSYFESDDFLKDSDVEFVSGLSTGESGNYGKTLFPDNEGIQNSSSKNIEVYIHPSLSTRGKAEAFSHEGYGHTLLYLQNGFDHQGASHQPRGMRDSNSVLVDMILTSRKETIKNMSK